MLELQGLLIRVSDPQTQTRKNGESYVTKPKAHILSRPKTGDPELYAVSCESNFQEFKALIEKNIKTPVSLYTPPNSSAIYYSAPSGTHPQPV